MERGNGTSVFLSKRGGGHLVLARQRAGNVGGKKNEWRRYAPDGGYAARGRISPARSGDQKRARAFDASVILQGSPAGRMCQNRNVSEWPLFLRRIKNC